MLEPYTSVCPAPEPRAVLLEPVMDLPAKTPRATLSAPAAFISRALSPMAVL